MRWHSPYRGAFVSLPTCVSTAVLLEGKIVKQLDTEYDYIVESSSSNISVSPSGHSSFS